MSKNTTIDMGIWERVNNPDFKVVEFDHFRMRAGLPSFVLSPGTNGNSLLPKSK